MPLPLALVIEVRPLTVVAAVVAWALASQAYAALAKYFDWPPTRSAKRGPASYDAAVLDGLLASPDRSAWVVRPVPGPDGAPPEASRALLVWSAGGLLPKIGLATGAVVDTTLGTYLEPEVLAHYDRAIAAGEPQAWTETFAGRRLSIYLHPRADGTLVCSAHDVTELEEALGRAHERVAALSERVEVLDAQAVLDAERRVAGLRSL